jgi:hypothetical protein
MRSLQRLETNPFHSPSAFATLLGWDMVAES